MYSVCCSSVPYMDIIHEEHNGDEIIYIGSCLECRENTTFNKIDEEAYDTISVKSARAVFNQQQAKILNLKSDKVDYDILICSLQHFLSKAEQILEFIEEDGANWKEVHAEIKKYFKERDKVNIL